MVPLVRNGFEDAIFVAVQGAHDKRCLIPDLSNVMAIIEEMVHGFLCLSTKYA
jgi:hypothetical protein